MRVFILSLLPVLLHFDAPTERPMPQMPEKVECTVAAGDKECGNMLEIDWANATVDHDLAGLRTQLARLLKYSEGGGLSVVRDGRNSCNAAGAPKKTVSVILRAPLAMDSFPRAGTSSRDFVVSLFKVVDNQGCNEKKYGVRDKHGESKAEYQFLTVRTNAASLPDGTSKVIGSYKSWALVWQKVDKDRVYSVMPIVDENGTQIGGDYVQCGVPHKGTFLAEFMDCPTAHRIAEEASKSARVSQTFNLLARWYSQKQLPRRLQDVLRGDPATDPAWGRCGNLGCCASM